MIENKNLITKLYIHYHYTLYRHGLVNLEFQLSMKSLKFYYGTNFVHTFTDLPNVCICKLWYHYKLVCIQDQSIFFDLIQGLDSSWSSCWNSTQLVRKQNKDFEKQLQRNTFFSCKLSFLKKPFVSIINGISGM